MLVTDELLPHVVMFRSYNHKCFVPSVFFSAQQLSYIYLHSQEATVQSITQQYSTTARNLLEMLARFITSAAFILSSFEGIVAVSSTTEVNVFERSPDALTLLPHTKRTSGLKTRDIGRRALRPQTQVVLPYGEGSPPETPHLLIGELT